MGSKTVKIIIILAVAIGILAILGITALVVFTAKASEPRTVDLNEEEQIQKYDETETKNEEEVSEETENNSVVEFEESDNDENISEVENQNNSALKAFYDKLEKYEGDSIDGERVNELLDIIRRNNEINQSYQIRVLANVQNWDSESKKAKLDSNYKIYFEKDDESGIIKNLKIEDAE